MAEAHDDKRWIRVRQGEAVDLKLFKARFDWYLNPRNGKEVKMVAVDSSDAVNALAITKSGTIVVVRQYRFGVEADTVELPGGLVDSGETPLQAAQRELMEETGYTGGDWSYLHTVQSNPVFMNSQVHQYLAIGVERTTDLTLDDGEHIQVAEVTIEELRTAYQSGLLRHPHTIAALTRVFDLWEKVPL